MFCGLRTPLPRLGVSLRFHRFFYVLPLFDFSFYYCYYYYYYYYAALLLTAFFDDVKVVYVIPDRAFFFVQSALVVIRGGNGFPDPTYSLYCLTNAWAQQCQSGSSGSGQFQL